MAELSLTCPSENTGAGSGSAEVSLSNRTIVRVAGPFSANTSLDLNSPGPGWVANGDSITISGASDFVSNTQFFRNGQLLLAGEDAAANNDVYFVASSATVAFEFPIQKNDILQVWKFTSVSG